MAAKKKRRKSVKHHARRASRRLGQAMGSRPGQVLVMAGTAAAGGVASSFLVNKVPKVKDMSPTVKAAGQVGVGLLAIFFGKKKWIKGLGAGAVIGGVFSGVKSVLKLDPLAGPGIGQGTLTQSQMQRLIRGGSMNVPVGNVRMNVPASVSMRGGQNAVLPSRQGGWGGVSF